MNRKLCVAGCSFSDYTHVKKVYGEFLAERLGFDYIHEGAGCGSNYRIWRRIVNHILNGNLTPNDIIIIQYTNPERKEFYTTNPPFPYVNLPEDALIISEPYQSGSLIRYKYQADSWQDYENDKLFFKMYESDHINIEYEKELFLVYHNMFQCFLKENKMRVCFIDGQYARLNTLNLKTLDYFEDYKFNEPSDFMHHIENRLLPNDGGHMSITGHQRYSDLLYTHIENCKLI